MVAFKPGEFPKPSRVHSDASDKPSPKSSSASVYSIERPSNPTVKLVPDKGARGDVEQVLSGASCVKSYEGTSQYAQHGISACGLASFNAVRSVFNLERSGCTGKELLATMMKKELAEETIEICSLWTSSAHLEVEEIHDMPMFLQTLKIVDNEYDQANGENFMRLLRRLEELAKPGKSAAAIITKPPEIITVFCIATGEPNRPVVFVVFDSHSRPDLHPLGAAFIFFGTLGVAGRYLNELLSVDPGIFKDTRMQWQAQLLSQYTAHYMVSTTDAPSLNIILYEANIALLDIKPNLSSLQEKMTEASSENIKLKSEIAALKEQAIELRQGRDRLLEERKGLEDELKIVQKQRRDYESGPPDFEGSYSTNPHHERHWKDRLKGKGKGKGKGKELDVVEDGQASYSSYSGRQEKWPGLGHRFWPSNTGRGQSHSTSSFRDPLDDVHPPAWSDGHHLTISRHQPSRSEASTTSVGSGLSGYAPRGDSPKRERSQLPIQTTNISYQIEDDHMMAMRLQEEIREQELMDAQIAAVAQAAFDAEHRRLEEEHRRVVNSAPSTFDCGICMDTLPADSVAEVDPCDHEFCRTCLLRHVTSCLEQGRFPIACPGCSADSASRDVSFISRRLAELLGLSEEESQKWWRLELTGFTAILDCRKCSQSNLVDKGDHDAAEILTCPNFECMYTFCKKCSQEVAHGDAAQHSCDGTKELDTLMKNQGWKHCPGCRTPVERTYGCNHMTCGAPGCNTHFCYVDGAKIVTSANPREVKAALDSHYQRCALFEVPAE